MKSSFIRRARGFMAPGTRQIRVGLLLVMVLYQPLPLLAAVGSPLVDSVADNGQIINGIVTALAQDRQGFIWIGTQYGLLRCDGYHFRRFAVRGADNGLLSGVFVRRLWVAPDTGSGRNPVGRSHASDHDDLRCQSNSPEGVDRRLYPPGRQGPLRRQTGRAQQGRSKHRKFLSAKTQQKKMGQATVSQLLSLLICTL